MLSAIEFEPIMAPDKNSIFRPSNLGIQYTTMDNIEESQPRPKRRRIDDGPPQRPAAIITSSDELRHLLTFRQDSSSYARQGIQGFKEFLNTISDPENEAEQPQKLRILKEYCDSQVSEDDSTHATCFRDIISTWNFAAGVQNESVLSAVPSVLALFLKIVSNHIEFRDFGVSLCKTLLQKEQLKLFERGLSSPKSKEHVISPCLRLLTEVTSFDGGVVARVLFVHRDITLKRLDEFLSLRKASSGDAEEDRRKPSVRRIAQRYVLALLKFQNSTAKSEIISQGKIVKAFLQGIKADAPDIIADILLAIERHVIKDASVLRSVKSRLLHHGNLSMFGTLYGYDGDLDDTSKKIPTLVHNFLLTICTEEENGVLLPQTAWYPMGNNPEASSSGGDGFIDLGLNASTMADRYYEKVPVKNGTLSAFIQHLHPDIDSLQAELLLAIFKAAPELVADYFSKKPKFSSEPKTSPTWLGQSAFLFSTIQLPVPANCGWKDELPTMPPPTSVVVESILPRPLDRATLTKCLNLNTEVITLFALRVTTVAFQKLQAVLKVIKSGNTRLWDQASVMLVTQFSQRCPLMKDVITSFHRTADTDLPQREAVMELIAMYYKILPQVAFEEKFDISVSLTNILSSIDNTSKDRAEHDSLLVQLHHLLEIAELSPNTRWWHKPESLQFSPVCTMLKVLVTGGDDSSVLAKIRSILRDVMFEHGIVVNDGSFEALLLSLSRAKNDVFSFLDNCLGRLVRKPMQYQDQIEELLEEHLEDETPTALLSPIVATIQEQWPFIVRADDTTAEKHVAEWIAEVLGFLRSSGEDEKALTKVRDATKQATETKKCRSLLKKAFDHEMPGIRPGIGLQVTDGERKQTGTDLSNGHKTQKSTLEDIFGGQPVESESRSALQKWEREDVDTAIETGLVGDLIRCLSSESEETRRAAFAGLGRFMKKLKMSTYTEWQPIYVLCGEVVETVKETTIARPLPSVAVELAGRCLLVLTNPLHKMYGKVNKFMNKGPTWNLTKIVSYWIDRILLREPEDDHGRNEEMDWLLELLLSGLRSQAVSFEGQSLFSNTDLVDRTWIFTGEGTSSSAFFRSIRLRIYRPHCARRYFISCSGRVKLEVVRL